MGRMSISRGIGGECLWITPRNVALPRYLYMPTSDWVRQLRQMSVIATEPVRHLQIQIQEYRYTNTNTHTRIQIHKNKYTYTNTNTQIQINKYTNIPTCDRVRQLRHMSVATTLTRETFKESSPKWAMISPTPKNNSGCFSFCTYFYYDQSFNSVSIFINL